MKILAVFRDIMSAKVGLPILKLAKERGVVGVAMIAEGKAIGVCNEAGFPPIIRGGDELKPYGKEGTKSAIETLKPDALVIGCSTPINWELEFAEAAQTMGIPVVACEDIWGALSRLRGFKPDLALVMDKFALLRTIAGKFVIIGDIASTVDTSIPESANEAERNFFAATAGKTSIMIVADDPSNVLEVVELVTKSIRLGPDPSQFVCYYSLWHPKYANAGQYPQHAHVLPKVARLSEGLSFIHRGQLSTDALTRMCDITVGAFTTPLRIAIHQGKRAVSVWGPVAAKLHYEECRLITYPLAEMGVIPTLTDPRPFSSFDWAEYDAAGRKWAQQSQFRPEVGVTAILDLVKR